MITILHTIVLLILIAYVIWLEYRLRTVEARATVLKETTALEVKMIDNVNERVGMNRKQIELLAKKTDNINERVGINRNDINTLVKCRLNQAYGMLAYEDNLREDKDGK